VKKILGFAAGGLALLALSIFVAGRLSDGPLGFFSGGPFKSGESVATPVQNWNFLRDVDTIELQLLEPARSRTVWLIVEDGVAFIPCGLPHFRLWKQWPHDAVADGRAVVRSGGKQYPVTLVRDLDPARFASVSAALTEKYAAPSEVDADSLWLFRLDPR